MPIKSYAYDFAASAQGWQFHDPGGGPAGAANGAWQNQRLECWSPAGWTSGEWYVRIPRLFAVAGATFSGTVLHGGNNFMWVYIYYVDGTNDGTLDIAPGGPKPISVAVTAPNDGKQIDRFGWCCCSIHGASGVNWIDDVSLAGFFYAPTRTFRGGFAMGAGAGKGYATPDGTVYLKKAGTFDPFAWGGRCMRIDGDISETLRAMTVTPRQNPLGGIERDGILLGPPAETTLTLTMKRKQAERKKTELKKCLWTIDERIHCKDLQAFNSWEEITRACTCKANVRTLSGTSWGDSEEMLVGLPQTCFQVVDIYRITGEEAVT